MPSTDPIRNSSTYARSFVARILYSDMDGFRHLNGGATGRYFEEGRADLNMSVFGEACLVAPQEGLQLLFANVSIDFLQQARYPGTVEICSGIAKLGKSSFCIVQAAFQDHACFATAKTVIVKAANGIASPLSENERATLTALTLRSE